MRLFSIITFASIATTIAALPTANNDIMSRDELEHNLNVYINTNVDKRDSSFLDSIMSSMMGSNLLKEFATQVGVSEETQNGILKLLDKANIDVSSINSALEESGLYSKFIGFVLSSKQTRDVGLEHAKRLYQDGELDLESQPAKREQENVEVSKKDQEYVKNIVRSMDATELLSMATDALLENKDAASSLISSAFANMNAEDLFNKIEQSGIVSSFFDHIMSKRDLKARFAEEFSGLVQDGLVERDAILYPSGSVLANIPAVSSDVAAATTSAAGLLDGLFGADTTTAEASTSTGAQEIFSSLFDASYTATATSAESTTTGGSFLGDIVGGLFGGGDTTTTATTSASTATSTDDGNFIEDIIDSLFGSSNSTTTSTSTSSSSSGSLLDDVFAIAGDIFTSIFGESDSSSTTNSDLTYGSVIGSIVESIFESLFGDSTSSSSSSSTSSSTSSGSASLFGSGSGSGSSSGTCTKVGPSGKKCCSRSKAKRMHQKRQMKKMIQQKVAESLMKRQDMMEKRDFLLSKRADFKAV